eukprot:3196007-Amphidinium_carterae.1
MDGTRNFESVLDREARPAVMYESVRQRKLTHHRNAFPYINNLACLMLIIHSTWAVAPRSVQQKHGC